VSFSWRQHASRVTRWVCERIAQNVAQPISIKINYYGKSSPKLVYIYILKNLPKVNTRQKETKFAQSGHPACKPVPGCHQVKQLRMEFFCMKRKISDIRKKMIFPRFSPARSVWTRVARLHVFKQKIQIWVNFGGSCNGRCCYVLSPFGVLYGHLPYFMSFGILYDQLPYFMAIWYIFL
jgi:hypothetical protein